MPQLLTDMPQLVSLPRRGLVSRYSISFCFSTPHIQLSYGRPDRSYTQPVLPTSIPRRLQEAIGKTLFVSLPMLCGNV